MKKMKVLGLLLFLSSLAMLGCDDEKTIGYDELPGTARTFIERYFPGQGIAHVQREKDDGGRQYEVTLDDGTELQFDGSGNWYEVDCKFSVLPSGILPETIDGHLAANYPNVTAYKAERQVGGYEVSVGGGLELIYAADGTFVREQRDY